MSDSTIVGWSRLGALTDLRRTVRSVLELERLDATISRAGDCIVAEGGSPTRVARLLHHMPGVEWVAVGHSATNVSGLHSGAARLAKKYLHGRRRFAVIAESSQPDIRAGDLAGGVTAAVLGASKGARVDEGRPDAVFRVVWSGGGGATGVELDGGPGGSPTGSERAVSMVSGGIHSSAVAWLALVAGFRVDLLHVKVDEESLLHVARLYSELSNRVDPAALTLRVVEGGSVVHVVRGVQGAARVFSGTHPGSGAPSWLGKFVSSPAFLVPESEFNAIASSLQLKGDGRAARWSRTKGRARTIQREIGGKRLDVSGVLEGLAHARPSRAETILGRAS